MLRHSNRAGTKLITEMNNNAPTPVLILIKITFDSPPFFYVLRKNEIKSNILKILPHASLTFALLSSLFFGTAVSTGSLRVTLYKNNYIWNYKRQRTT